MIIYIVFHGYHIRKKHQLFSKEVGEAEEAIRRGFAVLQRDMLAELAATKGAKSKKGFSAEVKDREEQLRTPKP